MHLVAFIIRKKVSGGTVPLIFTSFLDQGEWTISHHNPFSQGESATGTH